MALSIAAPVDPVRCRVGQWVATLDAADRKVFGSAVASIVKQRESGGRQATTGFTAAWLSAELAKADVRLSADQLNRHIKGACGCLT